MEVEFRRNCIGRRAQAASARASRSDRWPGLLIVISSWRMISGSVSSKHIARHLETELSSDESLEVVRVVGAARASMGSVNI